MRNETDEESGNSDEEDLDANNLTRHQLLAPGIVEQQQKDKYLDEEEEDVVSMAMSPSKEITLLFCMIFIGKTKLIFHKRTATFS